MTEQNVLFYAFFRKQHRLSVINTFLYLRDHFEIYGVCELNKTLDILTSGGRNEIQNVESTRTSVSMPNGDSLTRIFTGVVVGTLMENALSACIAMFQSTSPFHE